MTGDEMPNFKLPPEPGEVPHPDHGIPGDAEELPFDDHDRGEQLVAEDQEEDD